MTENKSWSAIYPLYFSINELLIHIYNHDNIHPAGAPLPGTAFLDEPLRLLGTHFLDESLRATHPDKSLP